MIYLMITGNEKKFKKLLSEILRKEGYDLSNGPDGQNGLIKVAAKDSIQNLDSLKEKVIQLQENFYREKKGILYKTIVEAIEKPLIENVLERTEGNQLMAARILGINRNTIRSKIRKLEIDVNKWKT